MKVGVVGGSGYGGGELLRLLEHHPSFRVAVVTGNRAAGARVDATFPSLTGSSMADAVIERTGPEALDGCELVFLATPARASMALAPPLVDAGARVVDLSGAFRLDARVYEQWYGDEHTAPQLTPAPYGLPELFRRDLRGADLIAGPGCSVTAALLALHPLTGLIDPATVSVSVLTGTSGAGRGLRDDLHASHAMGNVAAYGAPLHRHTPEMEALWARAAAARGTVIAPSITFVPHLVPMVRGLVATVTATLARGAGTDAVTGADAVKGAVADTYADEPFVSVVPAWPSTAHVVGGNSAHVHATVDERTGRVIVSCALDNLIKGAAGQALQAANAAAGLPEESGLPIAGVYP